MMSSTSSSTSMNQEGPPYQSRGRSGSGGPVVGNKNRNGNNKVKAMVEKFNNGTFNNNNNNFNNTNHNHNHTIRSTRNSIKDQDRLKYLSNNNNDKNNNNENDYSASNNCARTNTSTSSYIRGSSNNNNNNDGEAAVNITRTNSLEFSLSPSSSSSSSSSSGHSNSNSSSSSIPEPPQLLMSSSSSMMPTVSAAAAGSGGGGGSESTTPVTTFDTKYVRSSTNITTPTTNNEVNNGTDHHQRHLSPTKTVVEKEEDPRKGGEEEEESDINNCPNSTGGENNNNNNNINTSPHVVAGGDLVRRILEQIVLKDCPPDNIINPDNKWTTNYIHHHPITTKKGDDPNNHRIVQKDLLRTNGQSNLADLCVQTLETIGLSQEILVDDERSKVVEQQQHRNHDIPAVVRTTGTSILQGTKNDASTSSSKLNWMKRQLTKKTTNSTLVTRSSLHQHHHHHKKNQNHESDIAGPAGDNSNNNNELTQVPKLQMFGSEYARFISTTPLAPEEKFADHIPNGMKRHYQPNVTSMRRRAGHAKNDDSKSSYTIETASAAIQTGAITDIIVTSGDEVPPKGYYQVSRSSTGEHFAIYDQKDTMCLYVKKEPNWDRAAQRPCVTAIAVIFPHRNEFVPPGFSIVRRNAGKSLNPTPSTVGCQTESSERTPVNLNPGGSEPAYLCFRRSREGNPITGIVPLLPSKHEMVPSGHTVLERTPRNFVATFKISQNLPVFLSYQQRLANLEMLLPLPLVMSVHPSESITNTLNAYYATGGTVVESRVGKFHIMDRSTHSLLSPTSINNRLSIIEASRNTTLDDIKDGLNHCIDHGSGGAGGQKYSYSDASPLIPSSSKNALTSSAVIAHYLASSTSHSLWSSGDSHRSSMASDVDSAASSKLSTLDSSSMSHGRRMCHPPTFSSPTTLCANRDEELHRCLQAMSFIPPISTGAIDNDSNSMSLFQTRVALLTPVLTSAYTRHGGSSIIAVEGLTALLRSGFFADDVSMIKDSSSQTTLLDIAIQTVCDVAMMGAEETQLYPCVEFVDLAVRFGSGNLSTRSIGYVVRFYFFIFHFGMSAPSGNYGLSKQVDQYFLDDTRMPTDAVLAGGAPQLAALSMKDMIVFLIFRLGSLQQGDCERVDAETLVERGVNTNVQPAVTSKSQIERANYTELAMHQMIKSGGSELFWYEMINVCGHKLFGSDMVLQDETKNMYKISFALLASCLKVAMSKIRKNKRSELIPRDISSKLMSIEMIKHFLLTWERGLGSRTINGSISSENFVFAIRRLVVPVLLANTQDSLDDPRVYRRIIQVFGTLWCSSFYRNSMKLELGVLFEHFFIRVLKMGPQILFKSPDDKDMTYLFAQQLELMKEIKNWFRGDASGLVELFLNYDKDSVDGHDSMDLLSGIQCNICQQLCSSISILAEKCTEFLGQQIRESQSNAMSPSNGFIRHPRGYDGVSTISLARESARRLRQSSLDVLSQLAQTLAEASATAMDNNFNGVLDAWLCGEPVQIVETDTERIEMTQKRDDEKTKYMQIKAPSSSSSAAVIGYWERLSAIKSRRAKTMTTDIEKSNENVERGSIRKTNMIGEECNSQDNVQRKEALQVGFKISKERGLLKAVDYFVACNLLTTTPRDIVSFLRIHSTKLCMSDIGNYLCENGVDGEEKTFWESIRYEYIRAISFVGLTVEQGYVFLIVHIHGLLSCNVTSLPHTRTFLFARYSLRHLLTKGGFLLPGEAQKIDRILTTFAQCYWEDNAGDKQICPFSDQDTIFTLSFAVIMLNTDLHKANELPLTANKKNQKRKRMTKSEFINNLRGVSRGSDIDRDYLSTIYDSIDTNPIMLNQHVEADGSQSRFEVENDLQKSIAWMSDNANGVDALLRGLSTQTHRYVSTEDYGTLKNQSKRSVTVAIVREMFDKIWHHFHGVINSSLKIAHLDHKAIESCVDLLKYALFLSVVHDMPMERVAFLDQLGRFRSFNAYRTGFDDESNAMQGPQEQHTFKDEEWYEKVSRMSYDTEQEGNSDPDEQYKSKGDLVSNQLKTLMILDGIINDLGITITSDGSVKRVLRDAVRQLQNGEYLLNDPNRRFLRQGDLLKRSNKTGRYVQYRFFLFTDVLIYAKRTVNGGSNVTTTKFKIHEELPLILMKVVDWFPPEMRKETSQRAFKIYHPRKTFLVLCNCNDEKRSWVADIRHAVDLELHHKVATAAARKAATTVPSIAPRVSPLPPPLLHSSLNQHRQEMQHQDQWTHKSSLTDPCFMVETGIATKNTSKFGH